MLTDVELNRVPIPLFVYYYFEVLNVLDESVVFFTTELPPAVVPLPAVFPVFNVPVPFFFDGVPVPIADAPLPLDPRLPGPPVVVFAVPVEPVFPVAPPPNIEPPIPLAGFVTPTPFLPSEGIYFPILYNIEIDVLRYLSQLLLCTS